MKGTLALAVLALLLALALTSCGGGSSGGGGGGSGGSSHDATGQVIKTVAIKESEYKLSPSSVTLSKPGTYAFKAEDKGSAEHSLTIEGKGLKGGGGQATLKQTLGPGQSGVLTVTLQKPGTYVMYCPVDGHEQIGMKGKVVVK
jgi:plastocyanin